MRIRTLCLIACLALVIGPASAAPETLESQFKAYDEKIHAELRSLDPAVESILEKADAARGRGEHRAAATLYAEVFARVPRFVHALRRQAGEELALGDRAQAQALSEQAVALARSSENLIFLASVLIHDLSGSKPSVADLRRARGRG